MWKVFVYGTLKPNESAYSQYCAPYIVKTQPAYIRGKLFHLPQGYPALTTGDRWVSGSLLTFQDDAAIARIDQFEDYDPTRSAADNLYQRLSRPIFSATRASLGLAWVYLMRPQQVTTLGGIEVDSDVWSKQQFPSI